jgi:hypothetical protein
MYAMDFLCSAVNMRKGQLEWRRELLQGYQVQIETQLKLRQLVCHLSCRQAGRACLCVAVLPADMCCCTMVFVPRWCMCLEQQVGRCPMCVSLKTPSKVFARLRFGPTKAALTALSRQGVFA